MNSDESWPVVCRPVLRRRSGGIGVHPTHGGVARFGQNDSPSSSQLLPARAHRLRSGGLCAIQACASPKPCIRLTTQPHRRALVTMSSAPREAAHASAAPPRADQFQPSDGAQWAQCKWKWIR
ncbi:hypothetical protein [Lysobacter gummosus]|uniref:hypothetical protein n=1 Tax=Lysobacter gummosus TaxID=262324 RepID=UPI00362F8098